MEKTGQTGSPGQRMFFLKEFNWIMKHLYNLEEKTVLRDDFNCNWWASFNKNINMITIRDGNYNYY